MTETCNICGEEFENKSGLSGHMQFKHDRDLQEKEPKHKGTDRSKLGIDPEIYKDPEVKKRLKELTLAQIERNIQEIKKPIEDDERIKKLEEKITDIEECLDYISDELDGSLPERLKSLICKDCGSKGSLAVRLRCKDCYEDLIWPV